jgi:multidrug resistance efflux pump
MRDDALPRADLLLALDGLRDRALEAESLRALAFSIANDSYAVIPFRQALVFADRGTDVELLCVSGLARPEEDTPYLVWLSRAMRWLAAQVVTPGPVWIARDGIHPPDDVADGWAEWWPTGAWCVPIIPAQGDRLGLAVFLLDEEPAHLRPAVDGVVATWAYAWSTLTGGRRRRRWRPSRRQGWIALAIALVILLLPVRQTALGPAEVVSRHTEIVSSPIDGVIARMAVRPNEKVTEGTLLFALEESTLRNRADVLRKEVDVADAEFVAAGQRAFDNAQSRSELTVLESRAKQRRAELAGVVAQLQRTQVTAPRPGVALYSDPNDWLGKPVVTGERILQLADPALPAIQIQLPVADAITLEAGADVTLYLSAYPLEPLHGHVLETSYQARTTDDNVVAYRLLASVDGQADHARLGLHGTAKVYGGRVLLGYYLLRRPFAAVRAWTGW